MAEQARSRLSKSKLDREAEEEEVLLRDPAPVPRAENFFNTPAKSFDINSIPHHKDEFGIAVREPQNSGGLEESGEEDQNMDSSLPDSLKKHPFSLANQTENTGIEIPELAGQKVEDEHVELPLQIPGSLVDTPNKSSQLNSGDITGKDLPSENKSSEVTESSYPDIQEEQSSDHAEESINNNPHMEATAPTSIFPSTQGDHGLVLSGPLGSIPYHESDTEDDIPAPLPSLSEISIASLLRDKSGLPFSNVAATESNFLENANLQYWDRFDNSQADRYLDDGFNFIGKQGSSQPDAPDNRNEDTSRVSPFAAYIPSSPQEEVSSSNKPDGEPKITSDPEANRHEDESDGDKVDIVHVLEALAGGAASSLLMKKFLDRDSGDESSSTETPRQPSQTQLSSQKNVVHSNGSALDNRSSSEDGLTFDEGAGVGVGSKSAAQTHPVAEPIASDGMDSETSPSRFTAIEKGKQVDRDSAPATEEQDHSILDLPFIASLTDKGFDAIGDTLLSMMKPSSVSASQPAPQSEEARNRIYPPAPPEPWGSKQLNSRLSQRRPQTTAARTESSDHDPNLAFMSSARKHTPITQPTLTGTKSLLSDYPDTASEPVAVAAPPTVTLPTDPSKAPVLKGQYELPSINKIDQWKSRNSLAPNSFRRLLINIGALILSNSRDILLDSYTQSTNNFENLPLTPSQRALLGLDPVISKVPGAVPVFKKSTTMPHSLTERPMMSTYVSPSHGAFVPAKAPFQKATVASAGLEYKDAATILNKSMSRSFNQSAVQDKDDLNRLMRNIEAREELQAEWKSPDTDPAKRPFGLHGAFGAPQGGLQTGVDMSVPDLVASLNSRGPVNRYQPALRTTLSKDHTSKADLQKDGLYVVGYSKVLKNLKVSEQQLDRWTFNLRKWLWNKVVKHVCSEMEIVDAELARQGLSYLDCKSATMFYASVPLPQNTVNGTSSTTTAAAPTAPAPLSSSLAWGAASIANTRLPSAFSTTQPQQPQLPTSLQDLEARYGESRIVKQRIYLESYLAVPGYANRKYVVERLQAMGPLLSHFIWDSHGVTWDGGKKTWSPDLPSDAQIVMHLFMTYIDSTMPSHPGQVYDRFPFTYKHYVPVDNKPDPTTSLQIKQTSKSPPNYSLVVEGSMWEVVPKRLNVWYTMVLFIYMVMKENAGYIGQINIGTQMIGLGDVVEGYDM
ncbi:hypothetical protein BGX27_002242 [Mortierella sp. AM989]|nr:hypothetical protein BGX27_002242 [Mortierella sp. AM989]